MGEPWLSVPVLSKTIVSTSASFSMWPPLLIRMPLRAAHVIEDSNAVGAATRMPVPKSTITNDRKRFKSRVSRVVEARPSVGMTRRSPKRSAWFCIRVSPRGAESTSRAICPAVVSVPTLAARSVNCPSRRIVSRTKKKATKKPLVKKQRGTSVGSIATNLHEGSRSEYLAQYVFSSFGTAVPVPRQEDTGLDIYCTLLERDGPLAWPRAYYSVQVKSTMEPWTFASPDSVRWIIEHPLPIFLCIVLKAEPRILIYPTTPRFAAWILPLHKNHLALIPGTEKRAQPIKTSWEVGSSFELKAPILNFTIQEALDDTFRARLVDVLKLWIRYDMDNIFRIKCGIHHFRAPCEYETNSADVTNGESWFGGPFSEQSRAVQAPTFSAKSRS
jgi:hypothetical protein